MLPSLREDMPSTWRGLKTWQGMELLDFFPKRDAFSEAFAWRGPELHMGVNVLSLFSMGGPSVPLSRQLATASCETVQELARVLQGVKCVALSIDANLTLISEVAVPRTSDARTEAILSLRRSQTLPAQTSEYFSGWCEVGAVNEGQHRQVLDIVIRRDIVNEIEAVLRAAGMICEMIFVRNALESAFPIAWEANGQPYKSVEAKKWLRRAIFSIACLGFSAACLAGALVRQQDNKLQFISEQVALLQPKATELANLRKRTDRVAKQTTRLATLLSPQTAPTAQLEQLAEQLSDDVTLTSFSYDRGTMVLEGLATNPENLIDLLNTQKKYRDIAFTAPIFRNPGESKSRFVLRLSLTDGHK